jgi:hypothetical protein
MGGAPINDFDFRFRDAVGVTSARSRGLSKDVAKMAEVFRGLYRTIAWAYVTNGMMAFQASEAEYRAFGYEPDYENLPWKENYDAVKGHEERFKH